MKDINFKGHNFTEYKEFRYLEYICQNCSTLIIYEANEYYIWYPEDKVADGKKYSMLENEISCNEVIIKEIIE